MPPDPTAADVRADVNELKAEADKFTNTFAETLAEMAGNAERLKITDEFSVDEAPVGSLGFNPWKLISVYLTEYNKFCTQAHDFANSGRDAMVAIGTALEGVANTFQVVDQDWSDEQLKSGFGRGAWGEHSSGWFADVHE